MNSFNSAGTVTPESIGVRLVEARRNRGMTQLQASELLGVARTTISAMEKGERPPRAEELVRLAEIYGCSVGDLVRPLLSVGAVDFAVQFRAARLAGTEPSAKYEHDIRQFQRLCEDYLYLEQVTNSPLPTRYPEQYDVSSGDVDTAAEEVANSERLRLGLGDGPIGNLWGILETDVGLRVFAPPFESHDLAGLFTYSDLFGGCIAVNGNHPEERRRWTAAHEYAHFLISRYRSEITALPTYKRVPEEERLADAFARFFLMPSSGLTRRFQAQRRAKNTVTPADLLILCQLYCVSFQAMVLRLQELRLLPLGTWDRLTAAGFRPHDARKLMEIPEVAPQLGALPHRFEILAIQAYAQGDISEGRLAQFLRVDRIDARKRVQELLEPEMFYEPGGWRQLDLDVGSSLVEMG